MSLICRLAMIIAVTGGVLVLPAKPAWACSCIGGTAAEAVERNDVVFSGSVVSSRDTLTNGEVDYTIQVDRVYKGDQVTRSVHVLAQKNNGQCGVDLSGAVVVWGKGSASGPYSTTSCNGPGEFDRAELGPGSEPAAGEGESPPTRLPDVRRPVLPWLIGGGGGVAIAVVLLVLTLRRGRRR